MKQTMLSKKESPLLNYAISSLNPEVFSHPVWVRFVKPENSNTSRIIETLISAAQKLQGDNPSDACQLLLACSVFQNYANQHQDALTTVQHVLALAKRTGLTRELIWANWGASAISIQQGNYKQAAAYLDELEAVLSDENEWVLADFVDVIKQSLFYPMAVDAKTDEKGSTDSPNDDLVYLTFLWVQQWGLQSQFSETELGKTSRNSVSFASVQPKSTRHFFSVQYWRDYWHTITLTFKGKFSFLRSTSLPSSNSVRKIKHQIAQATSKSPEVAISHLTKDVAASYSSLLPLTSPSTKEHIAEKQNTTISVMVQMLGHFNLTVQDSPLRLPTSRGLSLLKYLLLHHKQDAPREVLMDIFWPDADPDAARNNLNVAMHNLRQAMHSVTNLPAIRFEDGAYGLAPNLEIWFDVEEFEYCVKEGKRLEARNQITLAITEYEIAVNLYQGDFLDDTPYENWTVLDRERLRVAYLDTLDRLSQIYLGQERYTACTSLCQIILSRDLCREDIHCRLMQCYSRLGQTALALRQYQICVEALRVELEVEPARETTKLYEYIRRREHV